jgi:hypothetical protein
MLKRYMADPIPMPVDKLYLDEAQDLSAFQWRVFHELSRGVKDIVMAGDDDQAIYGFIGGRVRLLGSSLPTRNTCFAARGACHVLSGKPLTPSSPRYSIASRRMFSGRMRRANSRA